jgi:signal transduction protein with GAF and PtsI domain
MGKFKEMVTEEMTTENVDFITAVANVRDAMKETKTKNENALEKAERAVRKAFAFEKLDAMWNKSCHDKFNEMVVNPRGRHFLSKGSPLGMINNRSNMRF